MMAKLPSSPAVAVARASPLTLTVTRARVAVWPETACCAALTVAGRGVRLRAGPGGAGRSTVTVLLATLPAASAACTRKAFSPAFRLTVTVNHPWKSPMPTARPLTVTGAPGAVPMRSSAVSAATGCAGAVTESGGGWVSRVMTTKELVELRAVWAATIKVLVPSTRSTSKRKAPSLPAVWEARVSLPRMTLTMAPARVVPAMAVVSSRVRPVRPGGDVMSRVGLAGSVL